MLKVNIMAMYYAASLGGDKKVLQERQLLTTLRIQSLERAIQADSGTVSLNGDCARKKRRIDMPAHGILNQRVLLGSEQIEDPDGVRFPSGTSIDLSQQ